MMSTPGNYHKQATQAAMMAIEHYLNAHS
jgi:hypothetical protein